jgi:peptidoglycan LD-endopeptidase CwlK
MMDAISLERLSLVHPVLAQRVKTLAALLSFSVRVTQGIRTVAQQDALYEQGRSTPGPIVTDAKGTESWHTLGCAVDVVPMDLPDDHPDWDANSASWKRIVALAPTCGLRDGICWKDEPHLQLAEITETPSPELQQIFVDGGVVSVWAELALS